MRIAGSDRASTFDLELAPRDVHGREVMGLTSRGGRIVLRGSTPISLASAFNLYLKEFLNTTYDWSTYEAVFPAVLPLPPEVSRTRAVASSYHLNVCTYGYSLAFVDWAYWEKHIDWMAMQGINMPLAFLGQEKVTVATFRRFGVTFGELQDFIAGPAFLPWFRMGNLQLWGGPITESWIEARARLQQRVLARMRALGMRPVLPAFAGFLPPAFLRRFPNVSSTRSSRWNGFPDPYGAVDLLSPVDPIFEALGKAFIEEQRRLYGTDHLYQCDMYNEMGPSSGDPASLAAASRVVFSAMVAGDPEATWVMQAWLFVDRAFWTPDRIQAYLSGVPGDRLWILDLAAEAMPFWNATSSFHGKPFIWNTLLNFGGQHGFSGSMPSIQQGFSAALQSSGLRGVGITMEGMWTNYAVFEYTLAQAWLPGGDPRAWTTSFGARRYGQAAAGRAAALWGAVYDVAYGGAGDAGGPRVGPLARRPALLEPNASAPGIAPWAEIWRSALALAPEVGAVKSYRFDVVDIGREFLSGVFRLRLGELSSAVASGSAVRAEASAEALLEVIGDLDRLLSTEEHFLLGRWLEWARAWGTTDAERAWLEFNARNQVTLWGPHGEIADYAAKAWGGLVGAYYGRRWSLFTRRVCEALRAGRSFDEAGFAREVFEGVELPWQTAADTFPTAPVGDAIEVGKELLQKYAAGGTLLAPRFSGKAIVLA